MDKTHQMNLKEMSNKEHVDWVLRGPELQYCKGLPASSCVRPYQTNPNSQTKNKFNQNKLGWSPIIQENRSVAWERVTPIKCMNLANLVAPN